ncbi:MAG: hypothetical protein ACK55I_19285, partial [bacterium]
RVLCTAPAGDGGAGGGGSHPHGVGVDAHLLPDPATRLAAHRTTRASAAARARVAGVVRRDGRAAQGARDREHALSGMRRRRSVCGGAARGR